jgi:hypothetical protein
MPAIAGTTVYPGGPQQSEDRTEPLALIINPERSLTHTAVAERIRTSIRSAGDMPCAIVHISECSSALLEQHKPTAILIGGQKTPWWEYTEEQLRGVKQLLQAVTMPVLGICGGHQLIAQGVAHFARLALIPEYGAEFSCQTENLIGFGYQHQPAVGADITTFEIADNLLAMKESEAELRITLCHLRGDLRNKG